MRNTPSSPLPPVHSTGGWFFCRSSPFFSTSVVQCVLPVVFRNLFEHELKDAFWCDTLLVEHGHHLRSQKTDQLQQDRQLPIGVIQPALERFGEMLAAGDQVFLIIEKSSERFARDLGDCLVARTGDLGEPVIHRARDVHAEPVVVRRWRSAGHENHSFVMKMDGRLAVRREATRLPEQAA